LARLIRDGRQPSGLATQTRRLAGRLAMSPPERYAASAAAFDEVRRGRLVTPEFMASIDGFRPEEFVVGAWRASTALDRTDQMLAADVETYLPDDLLVKMDIATMAYSVEARSPLLDHVVMEFAASVPPEYKLANGSGKVLLKRALRPFLPAEVLTRPKMGFSVPIARWLREELQELPGDILLDPRTIDRGYFRRSEVEALIREHQENVADHSRRLWMLLQLEIWHREVVEASPSAEFDAAGSNAK
jgi:asparagine synthase (glutamine-hydrolysing)